MERAAALPRHEDGTRRSRSTPARRNDRAGARAAFPPAAPGGVRKNTRRAAPDALRDRREQPVVLRRVLERHYPGRRAAARPLAGPSFGELVRHSLLAGHAASSPGPAGRRASRCSSPAPRRLERLAPKGSSRWSAGRWSPDGPSSPPAPARGAGGELRGGRVHADLRIEEDVELARRGWRAPSVERPRAGVEVRGAAARERGLGVAARAEVEEVQRRRAAARRCTQPRTSAFHTEWSWTCAETMPMRGLPRSARLRRRRAGGARPARDCHAPIRRGAQRAVAREQLAVRLLLVGEVERLMHAHRQVGVGPAAGGEPLAQRVELRGEGMAAFGGVGAEAVHRGQLRHRARPARLGKVGARVDRRLELGERGLPVAESHVSVPRLEAGVGEPRVRPRSRGAGWPAPRRSAALPSGSGQRRSAPRQAADRAAPPRDTRRAPPSHRRGRGGRWRGCDRRPALCGASSTARRSSAIAWSSCPRCASSLPRRKQASAESGAAALAPNSRFSMRACRPRR